MYYLFFEYLTALSVVLDSDVVLVLACMFVEVASRWVLLAISSTDWLSSLTAAWTSTLGLASSHGASGPRRAGHSSARVPSF